jgi:CRP/FNR family transcriptional regulator
MLASDKQQQTLVSIFQEGTKLDFKKGELIVHPGETPTGVFYIEKGLIKAYNISKYGEENLLILRKSQEVFPLIWAFTGQERNIIYQALDNTVLWRLSRQKFLKHALGELDTLLPVFDMTMEMYRTHSERIFNLEYRTVRERLISFLVQMSARFGVKTDGGILIDVSLKQQDIASSINASRETTSRELVRLERLGLIKNNGSGKLCLLKLDKLKAQL